ncbi:hypothetical protein N7494_000565 [Penicillium frequentans]|uniref:Uncharacterized protein n=1 Tax=Penicillium frequentans TaxID=3151616 RepID=A0AAD6D808_9EURO|nr:hypothetical protein N7494_000565 [Penicillium glabrum]
MQINRQDSRGQTMLWYAVAGRDYKKMLFFVRCGADASVPDSEGTTPFHVALTKGDKLMAKILLDTLSATGVSTILHNGRLHLDQLLLGHAQCLDSAEAINFLLDLGANINTVNSNHEKPLMLAICCEDLRAMEMMLR